MNSQEQTSSTIAVNDLGFTTTLSLPNEDLMNIKDMLIASIEGKHPQVSGILLPKIGLVRGFIGVNKETAEKVQRIVDNSGSIIMPSKTRLYDNLTMLALINFIKDVPLVDFKDDKQFAAVMKLITQDKILTSKELCEKYNFDKSTISRWINGKSSPHNIIREEIVQGAIIKAQEQVETLAGSFLGTSKELSSQKN